MDTPAALNKLRHTLVKSQSRALRRKLIGEHNARRPALSTIIDSLLAEAEAKYRLTREAILRKHEEDYAAESVVYRREMKEQMSNVHRKILAQMRAALDSCDDIFLEGGSSEADEGSDKEVQGYVGMADNEITKPRFANKRALDEVANDVRVWDDDPAEYDDIVDEPVEEDSGVAQGADGEATNSGVTLSSPVLVPNSYRRKRRRLVQSDSSDDSGDKMTEPSTPKLALNSTVPNIGFQEDDDKGPVVDDEYEEHAIPSTPADVASTSWESVHLSLDPELEGQGQPRRILNSHDADNLLHLDEDLKPCIMQEIQEITKRKDWRTVVGDAVCIRRAVGKRRSRDIGDFTCQTCLRQRKLCARSVSHDSCRRLIVVPLPPALRSSSDPSATSYWKLMPNGPWTAQGRR